MASAARTKEVEVGVLGRNLAVNLWHKRQSVYPKLSRRRLVELAGIPGSETLIEGIEAAQDPDVKPPNCQLETVEKLAAGLRKAGVDVDAAQLLATPSKPTGRRDHLRSVPGTGDALPLRRRIALQV